jgi:hypothetical protein
VSKFVFGYPTVTSDSISEFKLYGEDKSDLQKLVRNATTCKKFTDMTQWTRVQRLIGHHAFDVGYVSFANK